MYVCSYASYASMCACIDESMYVCKYVRVNFKQRALELSAVFKCGEETTDVDEVCKQLLLKWLDSNDIRIQQGNHHAVSKRYAVSKG